MNEKINVYASEFATEFLWTEGPFKHPWKLQVSLHSAEVHAKFMFFLKLKKNLIWLLNL